MESSRGNIDVVVLDRMFSCPAVLIYVFIDWSRVFLIAKWFWHRSVFIRARFLTASRFSDVVVLFRVQFHVFILISFAFLIVDAVEFLVRYDTIRYGTIRYNTIPF